MPTKFGWVSHMSIAYLPASCVIMYAHKCIDNDGIPERRQECKVQELSSNACRDSATGKNAWELQEQESGASCCRP